MKKNRKKLISASMIFLAVFLNTTTAKAQQMYYPTDIYSLKDLNIKGAAKVVTDSLNGFDKKGKKIDKDIRPVITVYGFRKDGLIAWKNSYTWFDGQKIGLNRTTYTYKLATIDDRIYTKNDTMSKIAVLTERTYEDSKGKKVYKYGYHKKYKTPDPEILSGKIPSYKYYVEGEKDTTLVMLEGGKLSVTKRTYTEKLYSSSSEEYTGHITIAFIYEGNKIKSKTYNSGVDGKEDFKYNENGDVIDYSAAKLGEFCSYEYSDMENSNWTKCIGNYYELKTKMNGSVNEKEVKFQVIRNIENY